MTADRPWPGEPGVPLHPEMDGWHWAEPCSGAKPIPIHWCVNSFYRGMWAIREAVFSAPDFAARGWRYLAPCILPSGLAAERAAAAEAMREACDEIALRHKAKVEINEPLWHEGQDWAAQRISDAIRALPIPTSDALAAAVEAARREEREACAALCERDAALLRQDLDFDTARGVAHAAAAIRARSGGKEGA